MTSATEYKATYSPGPWHTVPAPSRQSMAAIRMANGEAIAFVNRRPNAAANARLLEAAPDMLEALRTLILYTPLDIGDASLETRRRWANAADIVRRIDG